MPSTEECQAEVPAANEAGAVVCGIEVHQWRSCGAGCKLTKAFCENHGGVERATTEMTLHMRTAHGVK